MVRGVLKRYWIHIVIFIIMLVLLFVIIGEKAAEDNSIKEKQPAELHEEGAGKVSLIVLGRNQTPSSGAK
jgi:uncharacterized alpha/beta hydrolase family protein